MLDRVYTYLQTKQEQKHPELGPQPENRLPLVIFGAFALPLSVILYGWTAQLRLPVWILLFSVILLGFSAMLGLVPVMSYVVDAFGIYSASALTALLISRCLMGTFLPLAAAPLAERLGWGWGMTILAGLSLALAPVPIFIMKYGRRWRQRSEYTKDT
jgi:MFS family permease